MSKLQAMLYAASMFPSFDVFGIPCKCAKTPPGTFASDKEKLKPKERHKFIIKGYEIMAVSRKDAIKKYNHLKRK